MGNTFSSKSCDNNDKSQYNYTCIYTYSSLTEDEKVKLISMIQSFIKNYNDAKFIHGTTFIIPKYFLVNKDRYFNLACAFKNSLVKSDRWEHTYGEHLPLQDKNGNIIEEYTFDNSELNNIILGEIANYMNDSFIISNLKGTTIYYKSKEDNIELLYGRLPEKVYIDDNDKRFMGISIQADRVLNVKTFSK